MSLYIIVGFVLFICSLFEFLTKRTYKWLYSILFFGLTLMLCLRFGQGTDYFAYEYIYENVPETLDWSKLSALTSIHSEVGWKFLCALSKIIGCDFYTFVAIIGVTTMLFLNSFIKKFCPLKISALFIAYPTLYLTYIFSGLRQALILCFFLGVLLDLYLKKKYIRFFVFVIIATSIHTVSFVLLILLIVPLKNIFIKYQDRIILISWIIGVFFTILGIRINIFGRVVANEDASVSYIAVAERILTYVVIRVVYYSYKRHTPERNELLDTAMYIFGLCMVLYGLFYSMPMFASRSCYFFKCIEIVLITTMLRYSKNSFPIANYLFIYVSLLALVMLFKNLNSYIVQGLYYEEYSSVWNFPYNNIFVKGEYRYSIHQELLE